MKEQTALWIVIVLLTAVLVAGFTRPTPTYVGVPLGGDSGWMIILNTVTGEAVKACDWNLGCMEMPKRVRPHPRNRQVDQSGARE